MFGILLKKQMTEIFRGYFYDAKKNKRRSFVSTVLFMLLFIAIMVGVLGGMFAYLSAVLCKPFVKAGMDWFYFLIMSMIAAALGTFGSVFNTFSGLYLSKDNDLLLSLPIPVRSILGARLVSVYLLGLMYSAVVIVPAIIVYWVVAPFSVAAVIGSLLLLLLLSLIILILSCVLGWCVAKLSLKLKNKSFITVLLSLLFFAAYYFVYFKAQGVIQQLLTNVVVYGEKVKDCAYPFYLFGRIGEGEPFAMLLFGVAILFLTALTFFVLEKSFISIVTSSGRTVRVEYKEKRVQRKSESAALLGKELGRFLSSPNYMLNCGMGSLFLCIAGVLILVKGRELLKVLSLLFIDEKGSVMLIVAAVLALCALVAVNDMVVPSVSLEGKNIWLVQSLPVSPWKVLRAKLWVQLLVTGVPLLFCSVCMAGVLSCSVLNKLLVIVVPFVYLVFMTFVGLFLGLKLPNLTWTNELVPIKQSLGVMLAMFGGWTFIAALAVVCYLWLWRFGSAVCLVVAAGVMGILSMRLYCWLKVRGAEIFERL